MYHEIKQEAKQNLKGNWGTAIVVLLIVGLLTAAVGSVTFGVVTLLITGPLGFGLAVFFSNLMHQQNAEIGDVFQGFTNNLGRNFLIGLLQSIYLALWSLLFIIPGIIMSYAYSMSYYVALDNPEMSANECLKESRRLMQGHKWELFCLELSFIGWILLCILTLGILTFWVEPWMSEAKAVFYYNVCKQPTANN